MAERANRLTSYFLPRAGGWQSGYANAGVWNLVGAVDRDQQRRETLGDHGVGQRSGIDTPQACRFSKTYADGSRLLVVAGDEHVAIDAVLEVSQFVSRYVLEG